ncbi:MAG: FGGY family carbohydrate kinase [Deltaproteobacteria bacterium]|nr:FGGY family carbohydrate kinase [Deltaproteobacteria bacterium]
MSDSSFPDSALYLALDQGGHSSRAMVFDARGRQAAMASRPIHPRRPHPGWAEYEPDELIQSLREAADEAVRGLGKDSRRLAGPGWPPNGPIWRRGMPKPGSRWPRWSVGRICVRQGLWPGGSPRTPPWAGLFRPKPGCG